MNYHAACLKLPPMAPHEYEALKKSIGEGWDNRYPILTYDGEILDGRHRFEACAELGIKPTFIEWDRQRCEGNPFRFVWQEHDARRNWQSGEQRQLCYEDCEEGASAWDRRQSLIQAEANQARREATRQQPRTEDNRQLAPKSVGTTVSGTTSRSGHQKGERAKAELAGTNRGAVQRAAKIRKLARETGKPDIVEDVKTGKVKAHAALKSLEEDKRRIELQRPVEIELPAGLHRGDFRELSDKIADSSVELVFTDPPYDGESVSLYEDAARVAARILKPGGSFIAYSGQRHLLGVLQACSKHLNYWWTIAGVHSGGNQILQKLGIRCGWKPLVWFVKGGRGDVQNVLLDIVTGDREKDAHHWQQAEEEAIYYIEHLTSPHGLVVDFFLGGGTTAVAAQKLGRPWIGFEIDAGAVERASERLRTKEAA